MSGVCLGTAYLHSTSVHHVLLETIEQNLSDEVFNEEIQSESLDLSIFFQSILKWNNFDPIDGLELVNSLGFKTAQTTSLEERVPFLELTALLEIWHKAHGECQGGDCWDWSAQLQWTS